MPDGVKLATDVYRPAADGAFPVVLARTPYDKRGKAWLARALVANGYAVALQDVRGQVASEGQFMPVMNERKDGLATLDWIAAQGWCDGRIGMWGTSYVAFCALIVVPEQHPALKTIINMSGFGDAVGFMFPGGAMHLMFMAPWSLSNQIRGEGSFADFDWPALFRHVPVAGMPGSIGIDNAVFTPAVEALNHPLLKSEGSITERLDAYRVPTLHITGWNDFVCRETVRIYESLPRAESRPIPAADRRALAPRSDLPHGCGRRRFRLRADSAHGPGEGAGDRHPLVRRAPEGWQGACRETGQAVRHGLEYLA